MVKAQRCSWQNFGNMYYADGRKPNKRKPDYWPFAAACGFASDTDGAARLTISTLIFAETSAAMHSPRIGNRGLANVAVLMLVLRR